MNHGPNQQDTFADREVTNWRFFEAVTGHLAQRRGHYILIYTDVGYEDLSIADLTTPRQKIYAAVAGQPIGEPGNRRLPALIVKKQINFSDIERASMSPEEFHEFFGLDETEGDDDKPDEDDFSDEEIKDMLRDLPVTSFDIEGFTPRFEEVLFGAMHGMFIKKQLHETDLNT